MQILLVEDDIEIATYICKGLRECGWVAEHTANGQQGLQLALSNSYDLLILDRMLPDLDGLSIVKGLRAMNIATPVLFLSALSDVDERVEGLKAGGDDYLVKPFAFSELQARIEVLQRRGRQVAANEKTTLNLADLSMNLLTRKVTRSGKNIDLQSKEFSILELLLDRPGRVYSRTLLLEKVWGYHFDTHTNVIDVHISNIRKKVDDGFHRPLIHTVRGAGYKAE